MEGPFGEGGGGERGGDGHVDFTLAEMVELNMRGGFRWR